MLPLNRSPRVEAQKGIRRNRESLRYKKGKVQYDPSFAVTKENPTIKDGQVCYYVSNLYFKTASTVTREQSQRFLQSTSQTEYFFS